MRKSLLLFIILALTTAIAPAKTLVVNLTASGMGMSTDKSYITNEKSFSADNVSFAINNFIPKADCIQGRANDAIGNNLYIYNTTALPNITKIEFEMTTGMLSATEAKKVFVYTGASALTSLPSSGGVAGSVSGKTVVYDLSSVSNSFFRFALSKIKSTRCFTKMTITYDEGSAVETAPEKPTFSVPAGEVAKGTSVTIASKGATTLTVKTKTADATDWASQTVTGETFTATINENITYNVVGHNAKGDSEAAEASYTVVETPIEVPATPTFSVAAGEVAKGTSVTITSAGATSLEVKSKTADATDWTTETVTGETFTATITESISFEVVGINDGGRSEAATAAYTIKADTPVPGGNITATVIFKDQKSLAYGKGKEIVWVADEYPSITFSTIATISGSVYHKDNNGNLRIYNSNGNVITVQAPEGYTISKASAKYSSTTSAILIDENKVASDIYYTYEASVKSLKIKSKNLSGNKNGNNTDVSAMTFVLVPDAPIVPEAPKVVTVTPAKAEAKVGESVSVTIAADGTPAPDIYYTTDGTTPTTESTKYAKSFDVTCDALADNEDSKVVTVNALAHNDSGEASGSATITFTRNDAAITVKDAKGNVIGTDGASIVFEDGAATFTAAAADNATISWSSEDTQIATVENGVITPQAVGTTTITVSSSKTAKYNAGETSFTLTVTSPYTYATVRFYKQEKITYSSYKRANWISEPVDGTTYTFATSVGTLANSNYPSNNVDETTDKATNLTITKASGVPINVQAPAGYVIVRASYAPTKTSSIMAINGEDLEAKTFRDFPAGATSLDLTPGTGLNSPKFSYMTFALAKVVAPTSLTIKPNKTEATIGQSVSVKIVADDKAFPVPTIYYTRDGSTPIPGAENTETYNPEKGFTLARTIPQTVTINAIAVNSGGQVAAEPVSIIFNDKDHVAPTAITFSKTEGTYPESEIFNVKLSADAEAYPAPTLYYTIGGYTAQGENHIVYNDAQGIDVAKPADGNVVTINAYAVNDAGAVINAATYIFSSETSTARGWIRIQDASQLKDGLNVIVAYAPNGSASTELNMMTSGVSSNGGLESVKVKCNNTYGVITGDITKAQCITLEGNATDGWYLKLYNSEKGYIIPKYKKSIKGYENGLAFTTDKSAAIPATIDLSDGNAYVTFNGTDREFVYNEDATRFAAYNKIADTQRRAIDFFREGYYTASKPYEDLYLVMKANEIGGAEVAMPFAYEGDGRYTLSVNDLQGSFYIRDGKANNGGTYFGVAADECINPETSTGYVGHSIDASVSAIKGEPSTGVKDSNGKDVYAYVGKNSGRDSYTLVYDPLAAEHYIFSTHPNTNIGHVARIDHAVFTVEYTPGSQTNGRLIISGMSTTGVDDISADDLGQARYFNLQGMPVANPTSGIYIRVIGNTATKVCIK